MNFDRGIDPRRVRAWRSIFVIAAVALSVIAGAGALAASVQPLEIVTKNGVQVFSVEMATTEQEKETGLMYRKELPDGKGMLFDFSPEQQVSMWMKNTYIPLIPSGGPAKGVLEVIAGTAKKYGIAPGDRVAHPLFNGR